MHDTGYALHISALMQGIILDLLVASLKFVKFIIKI